jgi:uncharacterized protein YukE
MAFIGMDPEAADQLATRMGTQVTAVQNSVTAVDKVVSGLLGIWHGADVGDFHAAWVSTHRPHLNNVAGELSGLLMTLRHEIEEQRLASGMAGSGSHSAAGNGSGWGGRVVPVLSGLLGAGAGAFKAFHDAWGNIVPSSARLAKDIIQLTHQGIELVPDPIFRTAEHGLAFIGVTMDSIDLVHGLTSHDAGEATQGGTGLVLDGLNFAATKYPPLIPVAIAGDVTNFVAGQILPTNNEEYGKAYDYALQQHFGSSYDPSNPTSAQADWGMKHFAGPGGFFNSIGNGFMSKTHDVWGLF